MPFPAATLTSGQLDKLRGTASVNPTYSSFQFVSICPNNNVYTAQVNGTPTGTSFAQLTYDGGSGTLANVRVGMTVLISHTNNRRAAFFIGRVRKTPTSTVLYINETSAAITDNDYIFVIDDYRLFDKLARIAGSDQFKDYDLTYRKPLPLILNLQSAYCGWISDPTNTATKFRVAFNVTGSYATDAAGGSLTYLWVFPATATIISGTTTSVNPTVDFASSAGDWVHVTATDVNGNTITRHTFIHAASDTYPPLLYTDHFSYTVSTTGGTNGTIDAFAGVDTILDNTLMVAWDVEYYNSTEGSILSTVKFVGRFRQANARSQTDPTYSLVLDNQYTVEGAAAQLARVESLPRALLPSTGTTTTWDTIQNLTVWRAITFMLTEHTTFCELYDLYFNDISATYIIPQIGIQSSNLYDAIKDIAVSINAVFEFAPQGESRVVRDAAYLSSSLRNSMLTVANFGSQDWLSLEIVQDPVTTLGNVPASGAFYNTTTGVETPLLALAPGLAQEIGTNQVPLTRQYLEGNITEAAAQSELNTRAGNHFARNNAKDTVTLRIIFPDGYNWLTPSVWAWYTWTIAATDNTLGLSYDTNTRWLLLSMSVEHDNATGTKSVSAEFMIETSGAAGQTVQYPAQTEISPYLPDIPAFGPYDIAFPELPNLWLGDAATNVDVPPQTVAPTTQAIVPKDGNTVMIGDISNAKAYISTNVLKTANPTWRDITPSSVLASGTWSKSFDFTAASGGWEALDDNGSLATWTGGSGWVAGYSVSQNYSAAVIRIVFPFPVTLTSMSATTVTNAGGGSSAINVDYLDVGLSQHQIASTSITGAGTFVASGSGSFEAYGLYIRSSVIGNHSVRVTVNYSAGTGSDPFGGGGTSISHINQGVFDIFPGSGGKVAAYLLADDNTNSFVFRCEDVNANPPDWVLGASLTGLYKTIRLTKTKGTILVESPATGGNALVAMSADYGASWAAPVNAGTSPGSTNGFDTQTQYGGSVSLIGISGSQVKKATALGGSYSNEGAALAGIVYVIIPWYLWSSDSSQNSGATPDYLIGLSALSGGEALFRDHAGTRTAITPSVSGTKALFTSANFATMWRSQRIAVVGNISGTPHVFTSVNAGTAFTDRGAVSGCTFILIRRRATSPGQLFFNAASGVLKYMPNAFTSSTILSKTTPLTSLDWLDTYG